MTRITIFLLLAAGVFVFAGLSADPQWPQNRPAEIAFMTRPMTKRAGPAAAVPRPMPQRYHVLLERSVFARDGHAAAVGRPAARGGPNTQGQWTGPPGTEATLALRGLTQSDGRFSAFVEDMASGGVRRFNQGDAIAAGRIGGITLNSMTYESGGKVYQIAVGENLGGSEVPSPTTAPTSAPTAHDGNPAGPGRAPGPAQGPPAGPGPETAAPVAPSEPQ